MNPLWARTALIAAVVATAVGGLAAATAASAERGADQAVGSLLASSTAPITAAHLRITLRTTSDWAQVHLAPGRVVAAHRAAESGAGLAVDLSDGIAVARVQGIKRVTTDVVFSAAPGAAMFSLEVDKGYKGSAWITISNLNGSRRTAARVVDDVQDPADGQNRTLTRLSRSDLLGTKPLRLPHADSRKLVLAFYYPWFSDYSQPALADTPAQARSVWDAAGVDAMTRQAKANGVNGFIVSWHGDRRDGPAFDLARRAAQRNGQLIAPYLETPSATSARSPQYSDPYVVYTWLSQALARGASPAFLHAADGVPVVFVYQMAALTPNQWAGVLDVLRRRGLPVHLVGDATAPPYAHVEWGVHRYGVLGSVRSLTSWSRQTALSVRARAVVDPGAAPRLYAGTVSPGFDDHELRGSLNPVVRRGGGSRYDRTWSAALSGQPDWVLVSTWNEWFEDTQIEPGVRTGTQALEQTADHAQEWRSGHR